MYKSEFLTAVCRAGYVPIEASLQQYGEVLFLIAEAGQARHLVLSAPLRGFTGRTENGLYLCPLNHENRIALQGCFPYTRPVSPRGHDVTFGLGDRLGICTAAHLRALEGTQVFPVLAQQSMRELSLTGRSNSCMLDDVAWQVFACNYRGGYAADGDHRKSLQEVLAALQEGATMITLDCSEVICNQASDLSAAEAADLCRGIFSEQQLCIWQSLYCGKEFVLSDGSYIRFNRDSFPQLLLLYGKSIGFIQTVYEQAMRNSTAAFELSVDETDTATEPVAHYFIAAELKRLGVLFDSLAPRFCGEFQKGIDYIGDLSSFREQLRRHVAIAETFGYRISVHSGSDKFSVFPIVGAQSHGRFHIKTSGTSWVEAVRVIAVCDAPLFREMLRVSVAHFAEAKAYYHVGAKLSCVPDVDALPDASLPALLDEPNTRQILHITYGFLLKAGQKNQLRERIYHALWSNRPVLEQTLCAHIRRHLTTLGLTE